ncbi:MAG: LPS export ABC transporter periplasmic protein LptC [gamma proteobacterium symbiont of Taylorina sp.]|nr:LPS export ABC transporter periplasmic protein LptC [gamma proteobacterium symbiont of Taylorina sp.]
MDKKLLAFLIAFPIVSILLTVSIIKTKKVTQTSMNFPDTNQYKKIADSFINYADMINYGETGHPKSKISADKLIHYPGDKDSELINPIITFFRQQGSPFVIIADKGFINQGATRLFLKGRVMIMRKSSPYNQFLEVKSPELIIWPDKEYAETEKPIQIKTDNSLINSIGMEAYFDTEHYIFMHKVKGHYNAIKHNEKGSR